MRISDWSSDVCSSDLYISDDNPDAAQRLKDDIEAKAAKLPERPKLYRPGRVAGTREMVVRANSVVVYLEDTRAFAILRVVHAPQQWQQDRAGRSVYYLAIHPAYQLDSIYHTKRDEGARRGVRRATRGSMA